MWTQQAYLKASNSRANSRFGCAVALSGDSLAVGARAETSAATGINGNQADTTAFYSGAVYVFVRSGGTWTQQAYVKASNTGNGDGFGGSVALDGDTLAVGAEGESSSSTGVNGVQANNNAGKSGAAYVFVRTTGVWAQQAYLKASNTGANDGFGSSIGLSGDTLAVGAPAEDSAATGINGNQADNTAGESGAAYVFVRTGSTWAQQAYLKASNTGTSDFFGETLSVSGDTVAVGAKNEESASTGINGNQADNSALYSGAVYVFVGTGGTWTQKAYLKPSNTGTRDEFGCSVALSADTLVVGALDEDSGATGINGNQGDDATNGTNSGAVYAFSTGW